MLRWCADAGSASHLHFDCLLIHFLCSSACLSVRLFICLSVRVWWLWTFQPVAAKFGLADTRPKI